MNQLPSIIVMLALATSSCQRSDSDAANARRERDAEAAAEVMREQAQVAAEGQAVAAERLRLEHERGVLRAEQEELRREREAVLAEREGRVVTQQQELELREGEAQSREQEMALKEQQLSARELELAGTDEIEDWTPEEPDAYREPVGDYNLFYEELDDYGSWYETDDYGYVYQPTIVIQDNSWRPYVRGRWVCSNLGWTWCSDEPFGWACFHYGRWTQLRGRGWCWVPGSEWAPSWVDWRRGGGHVGWAPLPPETLCYRKRGWGVSVGLDFGIGQASYSFVEERYMASPAWRHCLPVARNRDCLSWTRPCTNIRYRRGRMIAGGPSYAKILPKVKQAWPLYQVGLDPLGGFSDERKRHGYANARKLHVFAPELDVPWNSGLSPKRVKSRLGKVEAVRSERGIGGPWKQKFAEVRSRQKVQAQKVFESPGVEQRKQSAQLQHNRKVVAVRMEERLSAKAVVKPPRRAIAGLEEKPTEPQKDENPNKRLPLAKGMSRGIASGPMPGTKAGSRNLPSVSSRKPQIKSQPQAGTDPQEIEARQTRAQNQRSATRARRAQQEDEQRQKRAEIAAQERQQVLEAERRQQDSVRRKEQIAETRRATIGRANRKTGEQLRIEEKPTRTVPKDRSRRQLSQQVKNQQNQAADRVRQQQEQSRRAAQERAKQLVADRARQQQEQSRRAAQERANRQVADRARQQQEQSRRAAQERANRQAADRARQQQEQSRRAAQERAKQQAADRARQQQELSRRAAQERAKQQQEQATGAAAERTRQRMKEQLEQSRRAAEGASEQRDKMRKGMQRRGR